MAKVSASERKAMPASTFGAPAKAGKTPVKSSNVLGKKAAAPNLQEGFTPMGSAKSASKKRGY